MTNFKPNPFTGKMDETGDTGAIVDYASVDSWTEVAFHTQINTAEGFPKKFYFDNIPNVLNRRIIPIHAIIHCISGPFNGADPNHTIYCKLGDGATETLFYRSTNKTTVFSVEALDRLQFYENDLNKSYNIEGNNNFYVQLDNPTDSACYKDIFIKAIIVDN